MPPALRPLPPGRVPPRPRRRRYGSRRAAMMPGRPGRCADALCPTAKCHSACGLVRRRAVAMPGRPGRCADALCPTAKCRRACDLVGRRAVTMSQRSGRCADALCPTAKCRSACGLVGRRAVAIPQRPGRRRRPLFPSPALGLLPAARRHLPRCRGAPEGERRAPTSFY